MQAVRSRPKVKLLISPPEVPLGGSFVAEARLTSTSETPVDFVDLRLRGFEQIVVGQGSARRSTTRSLTGQQVHHTPGLLKPGEHGFAGRFRVPEQGPATFAGHAAAVCYELDVHVSIPWWPDRRMTFTIPTAWPPRTVGAPRAQIFATSSTGPSHGQPYMEVSLDRTEILAGESIQGSVSFANVRKLDIRGVRLVYEGIESLRWPSAMRRVLRSLRAQIHVGPVVEGEPIPFDVTFPVGPPPSFWAHLFDLVYEMEIRADVAWGTDVALRIPLVVHPPDPKSRQRRGTIVPVGKERRALVWANVAKRAGLENDAEDERMLAKFEGVSMVVQLEQRPDDMYVACTLAWPHLGLDLAIGERRWTSLFDRHVELAHPKANRRFRVHAREHAQASALLGVDLLAALVAIREVHADDDGARLALIGNAHNADRLHRIVRALVAAARAFAAGIARVPAPAAMGAHVVAWEAFAARVHGRLERGRMWVTGTWGPDPVEVGTVWSADGELRGTRVAVVFDPPLDAPIDLESPLLSPIARDELRALLGETTARFAPDVLEVLLPGMTPDPTSAEPWLERLTRLARALRGQVQAGPFR
jgi:hypothetical protein